ncbi:MAG: Ig-like domain-containing protein [Planctomycetota bacterium]
MIHRQPWKSSPIDPKSAKRRGHRRRKSNRLDHGKRRLSLEGLETRQLLAGEIGPIAANGTLEEYDGPRNIGTVTALQITEDENFGDLGENDFFQDAQLIPLGTGPGDRDTIDVSGSAGFIPSAFGFQPDVDYYRVELEAGDILDVATLGSTTSFTVLFGEGHANNFNGELWYGVDTPIGGYPSVSPLQTLGNASFAQVAPSSGNYYIVVAAEGAASTYTMGLRAYRPVTESLPVGQSQTVFLDFDGGLYTRDTFSNLFAPDPGFPVGGLVRIPTLQQTLNEAGLVVANDAEYDQVKQIIVDSVREHYAALGVGNVNGDFQSTSQPGDFGIRIVTSDEFPGDLPNDASVTRVVMGSSTSFPELQVLPNFGIAESVDIGNFDLNETTFVNLDLLAQDGITVPRSSTISELEAASLRIAGTVSHEMAHLFGIHHTDPTNLTPSIIDTGATQEESSFNRLGVGPDGILGTSDDMPVRFRTDFFDAATGIFGTEYTPQSLALGLSTGTLGTQVSGQVFNDLNGNGSFAGDPGLSGVTVFLDLDGDGVLDASDPTATTDGSGNYVFPVSTSTLATNATVYAVVPAGFEGSTTPFTTSVIVNNAVVTAISGTATATSLPSFGFESVTSGPTGTVFETLVDGSQGPGIAGLYVYADLDGDNLPDFGEPSAITDANGDYVLEVGALGVNYSIRIADEPGLEIVTPSAAVENEYDEFANGIALTDRDFGLRSSRDYGDAPASYGTLRANDGPSHGIVSGLSIGSAVDRESDGIPTAAATGDDVVDASIEQIDDEDGVDTSTLLRPGLPGVIEVSVVNTTGQVAYLQGWIDFQQDGVFDADDRLPTTIVTTSGVEQVSFTVPAGAAIGDTIARFRLSLTDSLAPTGAVDSGEVEDHSVRILTDGNIVNPDFSPPAPAGVVATLPVVPRNTGEPGYVPVLLDVLANDFNTPANPLNILGPINTALGTVTVSGAIGQEVLFYTPPVGFVGDDTFQYTIQDAAGTIYTTTATVRVAFQSDDPVAVDDTFRVPAGAGNVPLNVLENDIGSQSGGITIASATNGSNGGTITPDANNQSLRYTPAPGFRGSEQFLYTVTDAGGNTDTAQVTIVQVADADDDDLLGFSFRVLDTENQETTTVQAGDRFQLQVLVDDLRDELPITDDEYVGPDDPQGVAAAFLDLLYTSELVRLVDADNNGEFDVTFGPLFQSNQPGDNGLFQSGDDAIPGVLDEIGSTQPLINFDTTQFTDEQIAQRFHDDAAVLFTLEMEALSPGVAIFQADPSDNAATDSAVINLPITQQTEVGFERQRLGSLNLTIAPSGNGFPTTIDDAFHDGVDSDGNTISVNNGARLDVLDNDIFEASELVSLSINQAPGKGTATVLNVGSDTDPTNDIIFYQPVFGETGFDSFTYTIEVNSPTFGVVTQTSQVTLVIDEIDDPTIRYSFDIVDTSGNPIANNSVSVGDVFGVLVRAEDIRTPTVPLTVFGAYLDVLYDAGVIEPTVNAPELQGVDLEEDFNFDVAFDLQFNDQAAVGVASSPGLINEFGSLLGSNTTVDDGNNDLATIYFRALQVGTTTVAASPADQFPQQESVVDFNREAIPVSEIDYQSIDIVIGAAASGEPIQNSALPADVNGDNAVSALDALIIVNELSRLDVAGEPGVGSGTEQYYFDVDGNGRVSAVDALRVINYLNGLGNSGQANSEPIAPASVDAAEQVSIATESVIAGLDTQVSGKAVDSSDDAEALNSVPSIASSESTGSEDDDELLDLLADDVSGIWS